VVIYFSESAAFFIWIYGWLINSSGRKPVTERLDGEQYITSPAELSHYDQSGEIFAICLYISKDFLSSPSFMKLSDISRIVAIAPMTWFNEE
jgi:hypothetical protein